MDKVNAFALIDSAIERLIVCNFKTVPTHVGNLKVTAQLICPKLYYLALYQPKPRIFTALIAFVKQKLHAEAYP